jgi:phosphonate transport system permease protein
MGISTLLPADYWCPKSVRRFLGILFVLLLSLWIAIPSDWAMINPYGWLQFWEFLSASIHPDLSVDFLTLTWNAAWVTLSYAVLGTFTSLCLGSVGALVISDRVCRTIAPTLFGYGLSGWGRLLLAVPRSLHEVIWGLLLINWIGLDPVVGILAIAIPYGAIVAKIFAEILDDTPRDALDSLLNSGSKPLSAIAFGLLPRAQLSLLSYSFYRFECSLRSAAILGVIGAGGLGYQIMLSLESLRYSQIWTLFYAIFLLNGTVDLLSAFCRNRLGAPKRFELKRSLHQTPPIYSLRHSGNGGRGAKAEFKETVHSPSPGMGVLRVACFGLIVLSLAWFRLNPQINRLWNSNTLEQLQRLMTHGSTFDLEGEMMLKLPWLSLQTLAMSVIAIAIAFFGAFLLSWLAAMSWGRRGRSLRTLDRCRIFIAQSILLMMRAIPSPMWALVLLYLFRPGILAGAIALGVHNMGVMGRLFAEDIENADDRGLRSIEDAGGSRIAQMSYGLMPILGTRLVSYSSYRWEVCVRESFILALVGAGGLGVLLKEEISSFYLPHIVLLLLVFWVLTIGVERFSRLIKIG